MATAAFSPIDMQILLVGWRLTDHARSRLRSRGVRTSLVVAALRDPELTYPDGNHVIVTKGRLALVTDPRSHIVLTCLLTGLQTWNDEEARVAFTAAS